MRAMVDAAREAGVVVMRHYAGTVERRAKADKSPVTDADQEAEALILDRLARLAPEIPVVAEESAAAGRLPTIDDKPFFLVDPLDGTKEFLNRNGEFTVNIALIERGQPTAGVVFAPAIERMFWGYDDQAFEQRSDASVKLVGTAKQIKARVAPSDGMIAVASRSHRDSKTEELLAHYKIADFITSGSSIKFCLIATGEADIYPRHGPTCEWDTAAGHAVLAAAGGRVTLLDGKTPLTYGHAAQKFLNPFFIAWGAS
ncbi:MAG: 3'(2'),5'-bisphosphate nucleotidase CysQ [Alphaproteobacteria bacterium]|nr:3'(2'),5'-bisphosphate nucleotidase CysQ [Alphaproteobacteria bacterium]